MCEQHFFYYLKPLPLTLLPVSIMEQTRSFHVSNFETVNINIYKQWFYNIENPISSHMRIHNV